MSHCNGTSETFSRYSLWYLVTEVKVIFFTFESADTWRFLYIKDASFICKMLLKLINFKSFHLWMTWSRFKYLQLLATFPEKLMHFVLHTSVFHCICPILNYNSLDRREGHLLKWSLIIVRWCSLTTFW